MEVGPHREKSRNASREGRVRAQLAWPNLAAARPTCSRFSFILVVVAGLLAAAMVERVRSAAGWSAHSLEVQGAATQLLGTVQALELAERGYLLTRSDTFLGPYQRARAATPEELQRVRSLVADNPDQIARVDRMGADIDVLLTKTAKTIDLGRSGRFDEAIGIVAAGRGQAALNSVQALVGEINNEESDLLGKRQAANEPGGRSCSASFWSASAARSGLPSPCPRSPPPSSANCGSAPTRWRRRRA